MKPVCVAQRVDRARGLWTTTRRVTLSRNGRGLSFRRLRPFLATPVTSTDAHHRPATHTPEHETPAISRHTPHPDVRDQSPADQLHTFMATFVPIFVHGPCGQLRSLWMTATDGTSPPAPSHSTAPLSTDVSTSVEKCPRPAEQHRRHSPTTVETPVDTHVATPVYPG